MKNMDNLSWRDGGWHRTELEVDIEDADVAAALSSIIATATKKLKDAEHPAGFTSARFSGGMLYEFKSSDDPELVATGRVWPAALDGSSSYGVPTSEFGDPLEVTIRR